MKEFPVTTDSVRLPRVEPAAKIHIDADSDEQMRRCVVVNPDGFELTVGEGCAQVVIVRDGGAAQSSVRVNVMSEAQVEIVEVALNGGGYHAEIVAGERSCSRLTSVVLGNSHTKHLIKLNGGDCDFDFGSVFIAGEGESASVDLRLEHNVANCRSRSVIKGVAAADGEGRFDGMVYVAPDAQKTDAQQTSRNVTIGDRARIKALPQLEIYADDVKCSHGATVGQMDSDAVLYMRQRGLSEAMARRMQIEGFVADVVSQCEVGYMKDFLLGMLSGKMDDML